MTDFHPAAQAVHDAFWSHPNGKPLVQDCPDTDQLVAAVRAAADQVVPHETAPTLMRGHELERLAQRQYTRSQLLAIADELEALANG